MSLFGLKVAKQFGEKLPSFKNQAEAETILFKQRNENLRQLLEMAKTPDFFAPDFTPESLKPLEQWYFELYEFNGFSKFATTRERFESCMAAYFGEVVIRNCPDARWIVREFAFESGKYEIGVQKKPLDFMSNSQTITNNQTTNAIGKFLEFLINYSPRAKRPMTLTEPNRKSEIRRSRRVRARACWRGELRLI
jgi:hypothetical protein